MISNKVIRSISNLTGVRFVKNEDYNRLYDPSRLVNGNVWFNSGTNPGWYLHYPRLKKVTLEEVIRYLKRSDE